MKADKRTKTQLLQEVQELKNRISELLGATKDLKETTDGKTSVDSVLSNPAECMSVIGADYRYVAANDAYCAAHNKKKDEIIGKFVADIWGKGIFEKVIKDRLESCFEGAEVHYQADFRFAEKGLRTMDVSYYPAGMAGGGVTHAVVVSRDITADKKAEKELLSLKKAVETMQVGVTITDPAGKILYTNPAEAAMHGYSVDELIHSEVRKLAPRELWKARAADGLEAISSWTRECVNIRKDRTIFPVRLMSDVVKSRTGTPLGVVTTCEDITPRKITEERIKRQMDRLRILREIDLAILSSLDLNVTLKVLLGCLLDHLDVDAALIMIFNEHTMTLRYGESAGFNNSGISRTMLKMGCGLAGRIASDVAPLILSDLDSAETECDRMLLFREENFASYIGFPLISRGAVKGTIEVFSRSRKEPDPDRLGFVEALAGQAAIAIDNAGMFEDLRRSNLELTLAYDTTLDGWVRALDLRDKETEGHSWRVAELTVNIASALGMSSTEIVHVRRGALLHDIGKLGIPDGILLKPGPLNEKEWEIMKLHPTYAYEMLSSINYLRPALDIPYCHHEKWDGTGYPRGLKGENIPLAARIFTIADVWDALCSHRAYRPAYTKEKALYSIRDLAGRDFDPAVVKAFLSMRV